MTSPRPWVAIVGAFPFPQGAASSRRVEGLARAIAATGRRVVVLTDAEQASPLRELAGDSDIEYLRTGALSASNPLVKLIRLFLTAGRASRRWLESQDTAPGAVIVYGGSLGYHVTFRRWTRRRHIALVHDVVEWYDPSHVPGGRLGPFSLASMLEHRMAHRAADGLVVISTFLRDYYARTRVPVAVLPSNVVADAPPTTSSSPTCAQAPVRLVYFGHPGKKDELASIVDAVRQRPGVHLTVAGPVDPRALQHSQDGPVQFVGDLDPRSLSLLLASSDFSIFLRRDIRSNRAGFPTKLAQSLEAGVPVITNITSDIGHYLHDGVSGLVADGTEPSQVGAVLDRAQSLSAGERVQMRNSAAAAAERLHWRTFVPAVGGLLAAAESRAKDPMR